MFSVLLSRLSFFFQAEDGIRDADVTGVQTCALPILKGIGMGFPALAQRCRQAHVADVLRCAFFPGLRQRLEVVAVGAAVPEHLCHLYTAVRCRSHGVIECAVMGTFLPRLGVGQAGGNKRHNKNYSRAKGSGHRESPKIMSVIWNYDPAIGKSSTAGRPELVTDQ